MRKEKKRKFYFSCFFRIIFLNVSMNFPFWLAIRLKALYNNRGEKYLNSMKKGLK